MEFFWFDTIRLTANAQVIINKDIRYLVNKFTHNTSPVVSTFLWKESRLRTLTNWNHPQYLWPNFILMYPMKLISMLSLMQYIFVFFFILSLQNKQYPHSWQTCGIAHMVAQIIIVVHQVFIYYNVLL